MNKIVLYTLLGVFIVMALVFATAGGPESDNDHSNQDSNPEEILSSPKPPVDTTGPDTSVGVVGKHRF